VSDADALYQALVVDHGQAPRRVGPLEGATHQARVTNPLCGDRVVVRLQVAEGVVTALRFEARGCLLATASASLLGELVEGQPVGRARELAALLRALVGAGPAPVDLGPLELLRPVRDFPARVACVELPWKALATALGA
jgi:nitrogen fixation NifU-like protein